MVEMERRIVRKILIFDTLTQNLKMLCQNESLARVRKKCRLTHDTKTY